MSDEQQIIHEIQDSLVSRDRVVTAEARSRDDQNPLPYNPENLTDEGVDHYIASVENTGRVFETLAGVENSKVRDFAFTILSEKSKLTKEQMQADFDNVFKMSERIYKFVEDNRLKDKNPKLIYHSLGHIESVMTNMLLIYAASTSGENPDPNFKDLGYEDVFQMMVNEALHEAGEWWTRPMVDQDDPLSSLEVLDEYRQTITNELKNLYEERGTEPQVHLTQWKYKVVRKGPNGYFNKDVLVPGDLTEDNDGKTFADIHNKLRTEVFEEDKLKRVVIRESGSSLSESEQYQDYPDEIFEFGFNIEPNDIKGKYLNPFDGKPVPTDGVPEDYKDEKYFDTEPEHRKAADERAERAKALLSRGADFMTVYTNYADSVQGREKTLLGNLVTYEDMIRYMVHALKMADWLDGRENVYSSRGFYDGTVKNSIPDSLVTRLDGLTQRSDSPFPKNVFSMREQHIRDNSESKQDHDLRIGKAA